MLAQVLKSKIHRAKVTDSSLHYEGSLGIDEDFLDKIGMLPYEKILVANITNGQRLETYAIPAQRGSKSIILNGAAARLGEVGDLLVIMSFALLTGEEVKSWKPSVITLDGDNSIIAKK